MYLNGTTLCTFLFLSLITHKVLRRRRARTNKIPKHDERVLVLGATSGIGRSIAVEYAKRGARVCIVGRRKDKVDEVIEECRSASTGANGVRMLGIPGDFSSAEDMIRVRDAIEREWNGVDTMIVAAGVSALRPLLSVAGVEVAGNTFSPSEASKEGIQHTVDVANAALKGNYIGPLVSAVTFIPLLSQTSKSPSILLLSSLASVIPAPTRSVYASTKSSSLLLYQSLSIEHPTIKFTHILPSTVEGDFRASAVDSGPVREANPNQHGLKREAVAKRCVKAVDQGEKLVFMPATMKVGMWLYWVWPAFVEWRARVKYNFGA
ncbi:hypothetical protein AX16_003511 [Volvariella volvacea WC 439]|nr:hypothetical protein AX16_003511 [Volvariella volvacea WC 439]